MAFPGAARPVGFLIGIDVQDNLCHFAPVGMLGIGVKKPQIGDEVLFVIAREHRVRGGEIGNGWVKWWCFHGSIREAADPIPLYADPVQI